MVAVQPCVLYLNQKPPFQYLFVAASALYALTGDAYYRYDADYFWPPESPDLLTFLYNWNNVVAQGVIILSMQPDLPTAQRPRNFYRSLLRSAVAHWARCSNAGASNFFDFTFCQCVTPALQLHRRAVCQPSVSCAGLDPEPSDLPKAASLTGAGLYSNALAADPPALEPHSSRQHRPKPSSTGACECHGGARPLPAQQPTRTPAEPDLVRRSSHGRLFRGRVPGLECSGVDPAAPRSYTWTPSGRSRSATSDSLALPPRRCTCACSDACSAAPPCNVTV